MTSNNKKLQKGRLLAGKVPSFPVLDIVDGIMVSVAENGKGALHHLKYNKNIQGMGKKGDLNPISFDEVAKFKVGKDDDSSNLVF